MNRCLIACTLIAPLLGVALPASAQPQPEQLPEVRTAPSANRAGHRLFPPHAQYGVLRISQIPHAELNGQPIRTAPGFRLFSADNRLIFAHTVQNEALRVAYVKEAGTQWLLTAWILTPEEAASTFRR